MVAYSAINGVKLRKSKNSLDEWYKQLLGSILVGGVSKGDRTGTGTKSIFGVQFKHKMSEGFPMLTSKRMYTKGVVTELLWFLGVHMTIPYYRRYGRNNIKYLLDNNCNIWNGDAYKNYLKLTNTEEPSDYLIEDMEKGCLRKLTKEEYIEEIKKGGDFTTLYGDLGPIYGHQWTNFGGEEELIQYKRDVLCEKVETLDEVFEAVLEEKCEMPVVYKMERNYFGNRGMNQIDILIKELKTNPDSRRALVTAWNPEDLDKQVLPPCHYGFQCYTRELSVDERLAWLYDQPYYDPFDFGIGPGEIDHARIDEIFPKTPKRELSLAWNQRSVDVPLGLPFNIASYALLLEMLAKTVNMVPGNLIGNLGDCHIYNDQIPFVEQQLKNETFALPTLKLPVREFLHDYEPDDFKFVGLKSAGRVDYPLSN